MTIATIDDARLAGRRVLLRVDINSPIDPGSGRITDDNRIVQSLPTIRELSEQGARLVIIAHQGDTTDYHNLVSLEEHAGRLADGLGRPVGFVDDVAGPTARARIESLEPGEILLLDNLRYLTEEVSTFERDVKLTPEEMAETYLVRNLAPLFDLYVNDAFAAAHRASPSMVGFQQVLPSVAGRLLERELSALESLTGDPARPCVFLLGGLRASDAFSVLGKVLGDGTADTVLTGGIAGHLMLMAGGVDLGPANREFIRERSLDVFLPEASEYLERHPGAIRVPVDVAVEGADGRREEFAVADLPTDRLILDIGSETVAVYAAAIASAGTVFVNGPPGAFEREASRLGTEELWKAVASTGARTVMGGGHSVASARQLIDVADIDFVSTGGGALIRYLSGQALPLIDAMRAAARPPAGDRTG